MTAPPIRFARMPERDPWLETRRGRWLWRVYLAAIALMCAIELVAVFAAARVVVDYVRR